MSVEDPAALLDLLTRDGEIILDKLDQAAAAHPDKVFLHYGEDGTQVTYGEAARRASRMAAGLAHAGVRPGDRVAVLTRNALVTALSMFAIWRAGAIFAPVNFNLTGALLSYQLTDADPRLLITDASFLETLEAIAGDWRAERTVLHIPGPGAHGEIEGQAETVARLAPADAIRLDALERDEAPPQVERGPHDPCSIIYTSGTTGPAKGVLQTYRWINQYTQMFRGFDAPEDVIYCDLPLYHVGGAYFMLGRAVWNGNTVGLWDRFSPARFWDRVHEVGATAGILLDVMVPRLMAQPPTDDDRAHTLRKIHIQPYSAQHHAFAERFGIDFMTVGFGQTEAGHVFSALIDEFPDAEAKPEEWRRGLTKAEVRARAAETGRILYDGREDLPKGIMGSPSPLYEVAVLDEDDRPVAAGQVGQLCLRPKVPGILPVGYLNKPEATLKVLKNCWFHTGDAVKLVDPARNGHVFIDRMGGFFRVRGENVSSFEVETSMARHPEVRACAAVPIPAQEGDEDDIAVFIEPHDGARPDEASLRAHAEAVMPRYMRPRHIRIVEALPVTPTSKVEKYKLKTALLAELAEGAG
ncbi:AMP-binding protein [Albimonas sp. CAU 1670]|uniref:AMP-binding protein n=1 Tax=Albimonas sp. CAU 1670 TaxID=3032599 RepID=UPI0023DA3256|nr:AMP-binding protein [Albimonas sp. CAU 1670]MDF2231744.1 AMP-binding protein [Albimonas sp. CAU 1670]